MIIEIVKRPQYTLSVDKSKNRIYYTMFGFWESPDDLSDYFQDWNCAIAEVTRGFTILTDATQFKTPAQDILPIFEKIQKILDDAGLAKTAEVYSGDVIAKMALDYVAETSGMKKRDFQNTLEAEVWLDEEEEAL